MIYVAHIDCFIVSVTRENSFILATDADVSFSVESVETLMSTILADNRVGVVCCRTFVGGRGPVVWYQKYEYAVAHWTSKVSSTNHNKVSTDIASF